MPYTATIMLDSWVMNMCVHIHAIFDFSTRVLTMLSASEVFNYKHIKIYYSWLSGGYTCDMTCVVS